MPKSVGGPASAVEPDANYDHVILGALRATFDSGITLPLEWRLKQLTALRYGVAAWKEKIVAAVALDMGRPEFETTNIERPLDGDIAIIQRDLPSFVRPEGYPRSPYSQQRRPDTSQRASCSSSRRGTFL